MDVNAALEQARTVAREVVRLGLLDVEEVRRLYAEYERFLRRGATGTFVQLLAARRRIDPERRRSLEGRLAPRLVGAAPGAGPAPPAPRPPGTAAEALGHVRARPSGAATPRARPAAWQRSGARARLWLECQPLRPIPLGDAGTLTIGRSPDCDLVLPDRRVSRRHVAIRAAGGGAILEGRSTRGVSVNGELRSRHVLQASDVITIGPYAILVGGASSDQEGEGAGLPLEAGRRVEEDAAGENAE